MVSHQSQCQESVATFLDERSEATTWEAIPYQPLDEDVDCTRLVRIHAAGSDDEPLMCSLVHVAFGDRPQYDALSYTWGDESAREAIIVDGVTVGVGKNLFDALHYLRRRESADTQFWIDALCINQNDASERNRQVRVMGHIYFRASTVVVWLGTGYSKYQSANVESHTRHTSTSTPTETSNTEPMSTPTSLQEDQEDSTVASEEQEMAKALCTDGYWDRLWIIQEVVQARRIKVCFGTLAMSWDSFIHLITMHHGDGGGPLRLARHRTERYEGSHTLKRLLRDHRHAICKEPRDKIYGLIGLAADAFGFPMDYNRSLFEIWADTMQFMNGRGLLAELDILDFGALVKHLLMGKQCGPLDQVIRSYEPETDSAVIVEDMDSPEVFQIHSYVLGCVKSAGPSTTDIVSDLGKVEQWSKHVQENFRNELADAHRESHVLIRAIMELTDSQLARKCYNHVSAVRWTKNWWDNKPDISASLDQGEGSAAAHAAAPRARHEDPFLFQISRLWYSSKLPWKMGIASSHIRSGDLVCWVAGTRKAILVRVHKYWARSPYQHARLQICGTALLTQNMFGLQVDHRQRIQSFPNEQKLELQMDARTLFVLLE